MMTISILGSGAIAEAIGVRMTVVGSAILGMLGLLPLFAPALLRMKEEPAGEPHETAPGETPLDTALEAESLSRP